MPISNGQINCRVLVKCIYSNENRGTIAAYNNIDEFPKHSIVWKKPDKV